MLRVYYADVRGVPDCPDGLPLSRYRLEKLAYLKPELNRRQGIGAELLLIQALRELSGDVDLPLDIRREGNGKPCLAGNMPQFSLSHTDHYAACAISESAVGLDIQTLCPANPGVVRRFFAPDEERYVLEAPDRDAAYTEIWCKKESVLKAGGQGITVPLASFSVLSQEERARIWHTSIEGLHISVCVLEGDPTPDLLRKIELP